VIPEALATVLAQRILRRVHEVASFLFNLKDVPRWFQGEILSTSDVPLMVRDVREPTLGPFLRFGDL
jgi:hypothetical protein